MTRAVFFDAGHTLLYAHPDLGTVYAEATATLGVRLEPERYAETFVPVFQETTKLYASTSTASDAQDVAMWRDITRRIYDRLPALAGIAFDAWFELLYRRFGDPVVWRMYDDVEPVLTDLRRRGLRIGVISNWDTRLQTISDGLGLTKLVDFLVISARPACASPIPASSTWRSTGRGSVRRRRSTWAISPRRTRRGRGARACGPCSSNGSGG